MMNAAQVSTMGANIVNVKGSLHHSIVNRQDEDQNVAINRMIFTTETEVEDLNAVSLDTIYIATVENQRFSFSEQHAFYKEAGLYHYEGDAIYPTMETQIIDSIEALNLKDVIVSNSLPLWLALNQFFPVYPSYLVAENLRPPFAAVHIDPVQTVALQAAPFVDSMSNQWQLCQDDVNITIYGLRNFNALDYVKYVYDYMLATEDMGLADFAVIRDEKQWQTELNVLAMRKSIDFKVTYNQSRIREVSRQLILKVFVRYLLNPPPGPPMIFGYNTALAFQGPFVAGQQLPAIVFLDTAYLARGVASTSSTGDFQVDMYHGYPDLGGTLFASIVGTAGNNSPQVLLQQGPTYFFINQVLVPVVVRADATVTDLSVTFGDIPFTWPPQP
jgi:hypothetical protein